MGPACLRCGFDADGFKVGRAGEDFGVPCLPGQHRWPERSGVVAEKTVRGQLAAALDNTLTGLIALRNTIGGTPPPDYHRRVSDARRALDRHRAEPEA